MIYIYIHVDICEVSYPCWTLANPCSRMFNIIFSTRFALAFKYLNNHFDKFIMENNSFLFHQTCHVYTYIYISFFALFSRESSLIPRFQLYNDLHIFIIINEKGKK